MRLLSQLLGNKQQTEVQPGNTGRNAYYEEQLQKDFGLHYGNEGWVFEGLSFPWLDEPYLCLYSLLALQKEDPFTKICIVAVRKPIVYILNTRPNPVGLISGLSAEKAGELMALIVKRGNTVNNQYGDIFVLTLS